MKKSNKIIIILLLLIILNIENVYATGGGLRKNSIKTCPDGVTYGLHSDGNGGTHWHRAATNGNNYYGIGDAIYSDPCPESNKNQGTAEKTQGGNNNGNNYSNNQTQTSSTQTPTEPEPVVEEQKQSNDTSIKSIIINGDEIIDIKDTIEYESNSNEVEIEVNPTDEKAIARIKGSTTNLSDSKINKVIIVITAEDGTQKSYLLNINIKNIKKDIKIKELKINDSIVEFDSKGKGSVFVFNWTKHFKYTYILNDDNATLKIYKDNIEVDESNNELKQGYNKYKIVISDDYGNKIVHNLEIERISLMGSIFLLAITLVIMLGIPVGIVIIVLVILKKKKRM